MARRLDPARTRSPISPVGRGCGGDCAALRGDCEHVLGPWSGSRGFEPTEADVKVLVRYTLGEIASPASGSDFKMTRYQPPSTFDALSWACHSGGRAKEEVGPWHRRSRWF